eukprot:scaffold2043_cov166-Amphora_coffeaeformis.AAC.23
MPNAALRAVLGQSEPSRRYIYDRCNGSSVYRGESQRPCCYLCWVPPPVFVWPNTCEQNRSCECIGKTGCCGREARKSRTAVFTVLLLFTFYALALTIFANLAASDKMSTLKRANFAQGVVFFETNQVITTVRAYVGLNNIVMRDLGGVLGAESGEKMYTWGEFCGNFTGEDGRVEAFADQSTCQECADSSDEVNCQKVWALLASLAAFLCSFLAWFKFDRDCFNVLFSPDGDFPANETIETSAPLSWEAGSGMVCMFCVSVLHVLHLVGHLMVPTPPICYDESEQEEYEEQHRAIQSINIQLPQVIPEVEEKESEGGRDLYFDEKPNALGHRRIVAETLSL